MTLHEWKVQEYYKYENDMFFFRYHMNTCIKNPDAYRNNILIPNDYATYISICLMGGINDT